VSNDEFQQAVHRAVPDGHTFKGYPIQLVHRNARRAFNSCLKSVYGMYFSNNVLHKSASSAYV